MLQSIGMLLRKKALDSMERRREEEQHWLGETNTDSRWMESSSYDLINTKRIVHMYRVRNVKHVVVTDSDSNMW